MDKSNKIYTLKTLAIALQASRDTVRKYLKLETFRSLIEVKEKRVNRFSFVLLIPFEEFEQKFKDHKANERQKSIAYATSKNPKNKAKLENNDKLA